MSDLNIVIVEDNTFYSNVLKARLEKIGNFNINIYENWYEANESMNYDADLVFMDENLPDRNGSEVLQSILCKNSDLNVVMMSTQGNIQIAWDCVARGANYYIVKGYDDSIDCLEKIIKRLTSKNKCPNKLLGYRVGEYTRLLNHPLLKF